MHTDSVVRIKVIISASFFRERQNHENCMPKFVEGGFQIEEDKDRRFVEGLKVLQQLSYRKDEIDTCQSGP